MIFGGDSPLYLDGDFAEGDFPTEEISADEDGFNEGLGVGDREIIDDPFKIDEDRVKAAREARDNLDYSDENENLEMKLAKKYLGDLWRKFKDKKFKDLTPAEKVQLEDSFKLPSMTDKDYHNVVKVCPKKRQSKVEFHWGPNHRANWAGNELYDRWVKRNQSLKDKNSPELKNKYNKLRETLKNNRSERQRKRRKSCKLFNRKLMNPYPKAAAEAAAAEADEAVRAAQAAQAAVLKAEADEAKAKRHQTRKHKTDKAAKQKEENKNLSETTLLGIIEKTKKHKKSKKKWFKMSERDRKIQREMEADFRIDPNRNKKLDSEVSFSSQTPSDS